MTERILTWCKEHKVSRQYRRVAWLMLALTILIGTFFSVAALGFYLAAFILQREGY